MTPDHPSASPQPPSPEAKLRGLLDTVLSGSHTDHEAQELRELLDARPELRPRILEQLRTHSLLLWELSPTSNSDSLSAQLRSDEGQPGLSPEREPRSNPSNPVSGPVSAWRSTQALLVIAASIAAIVWSWGLNSKAPVALGRIIPGADLRLTSACTALGDDDRISAGLLAVESGSLAIEFASGVRVDLLGPAECELVSGMLVRMTHGQATADVPRWARGFTIETPDVGVVDLGTRFGMMRKPLGKTDVVVFEGEVDLKSLSSEPMPFERRLTQGEAARIDRRGKIERIFQVHGDWTGNGWSTLQRPDGPNAVISAVWDNLGANKSVSYYQILTAGLSEDAPAYVDHPHEWNGEAAAGLPSFLAGADYVRTVNDYRYRGELAIHVEFAQDADLYVFFDNRTPKPTWLVENYEDTGVDVGLDEDAWHGNPTFTVAVGAGRSIDNHFSIWRRPCFQGDVVTLGSMGMGREARAMYGIAATPR